MALRQSEEVLNFPIISAITGEFSDQFREWWPFDGHPIFVGNQKPYSSDIKNVLGLTYVFRAENVQAVVPIVSYMGRWKAHVMTVSAYKMWVRKSSLDRSK